MMIIIKCYWKNEGNLKQPTLLIMSVLMLILQQNYDKGQKE